MKPILFVLLSLVAAAPGGEVVQVQSSEVDARALVFAAGHKTRFSSFVNGRTHQQTPLVTHRGYQYVTYYDHERRVCVGRRKLPAGGWDIIRFDDYRIKSSDSHNTVVLGICEKDGTIHLAFDHHVSSLHYRVSEKGAANDPAGVGWDASLFGPITDRLGSVGPVNKVTYPRFFNAPNGNLILYYRYFTSGNGDGVIQEYNGATHDWTRGLGRFIARDIGTYTYRGTTSKLRCPYLNTIGYAGNRLHASWVWRDRFEKTAVQNQHDLCYAFSDDHGRTWRSSEGAVIGRTGSSSVIHLDSPGLVVGQVAPGLGLTNQNSQYAYPDGRVHIVVVHAADQGSRRRFQHYWRDARGSWHHRALPFSGGRPKLVGDREGTLFLLHEDDRRFQIARGVPNAAGTDWTWSRFYTEQRVNLGGEAVVDFTRWAKEGVLSSYGQEVPGRKHSSGRGDAVDGYSSPLHVIDYQVSTRAVRPVPSAGADHVPVNTPLSWTPGLGAASHRLYLGTDAQQVAQADPSSRGCLGTFEEAEYRLPRTFKNGINVFWRVDEVGSDGSVVPGMVWSFTTAQ